MKRAVGLLCPIFSIFGRNGIGNFSTETKYFIDYIKDLGFKYLQILPLGKIGLGNSPYMSESGFSGNELYISPDFLYEQNLISKEDVNSAVYHGNTYKVDYDFARENSSKILAKAYQNINDEWKEKTDKFSKKYAYWLDDYAYYKALIEHFKVDTFLGFPKEVLHRDKNVENVLKTELEDRIYYYKFVETLFFENWKQIKNFANEKGIKIIGDLPFYLSPTACEVWLNYEQFLVDENFVPKKVAGVPPDYFNEKGQKWGFALYNYPVMKKDNYKYLMKKYEYQLELYDVLRIDHFRAFDSYFTIDNNAEDGRVGTWEEGIGREFLPELIKKFGVERFIAEDLGCSSGKVKELVEKTGIPPMRVFQFGFDGRDNEHLPHNYTNNMVVYTGTHDNNTCLGWLYELDESTRRKVLSYIDYKDKYWGVGGRENTSIKKIITTLLESSAGLVIIPVQDILGFGGDTRCNIPGVAEGNWEYRLETDNQFAVDEDFLRENITRYFR